MIALVILSIGIVMPFYIKPEDTEAATGTATASTMTFTSTSNAASVDLVVDSPDGTAVFSDTSHMVSFSIKTNNYSGYRVYLSTTSSDVSLVNGHDTFSALPDGYSVTKANFASGSSYNNRWGVIPNYFNSSINSNVRGLPTAANVDTLLRETSSANASTAHAYTIGMAAKADYSKASGAYTTSNLVIKYVAKPVTYTITYNKNTTDTVSNLPGTQSGSTADTTIALSSTVPTRSGAVFIGWCSTTTISDGGTDTCSGTVYQPGGNYGIDQTTTNTPTLRAMWDTSGCNPTALTIGDAVCMQDMNESVINTMEENMQYRLIDKRDGKEYSIAKMPDGKVWMTQNLSLSLSTSTTLRHASTDLGWETDDASATWTPSASTLNTDWSNSSTAPVSATLGDAWYYRSHANTSLNLYTSLSSCEAGVDDGDNPDPYCGHAHIGNYYNWAAAVASNNTANISNGSNAPNSICPAGWRLPKSEGYDTYSEIGALLYKIEYLTGSVNATAWLDEYSNMDSERWPIYLVPAGSIVPTAGPTNMGSEGIYWTSGKEDSTHAFGMVFNESTVDSNTQHYSYIGSSIRCVARTTAVYQTTVYFNANGGSGTMSEQIVSGGQAAVLNGNTFSRSGYRFTGWATSANGGGTRYSNYDYFYAMEGQSDAVTLYAQWEKTINFAAGNNIDLIIVAKQSGTRKPFYATPNNPVTLNVDTGDVLMVTVVPKSGYKLNSWTQSSSGQSGTMASSTLLTTTLTVGGTATNPTWTANGTSGTYTTMQSLSSCSSATNVTDSRNNISYTVGPITVSGTTYCYMLSNLRLGPSIALTNSTSDVSSNFTMPNSTWDNHYCQAKMAINNNEYYYNWYAATANPTTGVSSSSSCASTTRDGAALGSICPAGWTLPTYATSGTLTPISLWSNGTNPGYLTTIGSFYSGSPYNVGSYGYWWSSARYNNNSSYRLVLTSTGTSRSSATKYTGYSVRCIKK